MVYIDIGSGSLELYTQLDYYEHALLGCVVHQVHLSCVTFSFRSRDSLLTSFTHIHCRKTNSEKAILLLLLGSPAKYNNILHSKQQQQKKKNKKEEETMMCFMLSIFTSSSFGQLTDS